MRKAQVMLSLQQVASLSTHKAHLLSIKEKLSAEIEGLFVESIKLDLNKHEIETMKACINQSLDGIQFHLNTLQGKNDGVSKKGSPNSRKRRAAVSKSKRRTKRGR